MTMRRKTATDLASRTRRSLAALRRLVARGNRARRLPPEPTLGSTLCARCGHRQHAHWSVPSAEADAEDRQMADVLICPTVVFRPKDV